MIHDILFYSNNTGSSSDVFVTLLRTRISAAKTQWVRLIYPGSSILFQTQTTDFINAICTKTG